MDLRKTGITKEEKMIVRTYSIHSREIVLVRTLTSISMRFILRRIPEQEDADS
ncbi:MAG: hypothetical protein J6I76_09695 [Oribacterium sp.]|uniref:hypothetical protein n=1 Tax=Oribacterium sp. C9 TaxID=1943579 RepID=UPI00143B819D|nr:hypothetical protein [Oribacterium sp. C9]MBP3804155.1 hypothetical protein [Oribacterium sp.]